MNSQLLLSHDGLIRHLIQSQSSSTTIHVRDHISFFRPIHLSNMHHNIGGPPIRRPFGDEDDFPPRFQAGPSRTGGASQGTDEAIRSTDDDAIGSKL